MKNTILTLLLIPAAYALIAQTPTIQDCLGAIPICQEVYQETQAPVGMGNYPDEINPAISCLADERNAIWYTFTVSESGNFGFILTPNDTDDDYDWSLFDITNADCSQIRTMRSLIASCNSAGGVSCHGDTGADGSTPYDIQGAGCGAFTPNIERGRTPLNDWVQVEAGNTYVLCVSNWTGSTNGYTIDFGISDDIGIFDTTPPAIESLEAPQNCGDSLLALQFSENVQCFSLDASVFQLEGPNGEQYELELESALCQEGAAYTREAVLRITPALATAGTYTLSLTSDMDFSILDLCDNLALPTNLTFDIAPQPIPVSLGQDTALVCEGDVLEIGTLDNFDNATFTWQDGSASPTFLVQNQGMYTVNVQTACGLGSDSLEVTYLNFLPEVELGQDTLLCENETLALNAANDFASYEWQDGSTGATFLVENPGVVVVAVSNACGIVFDSINVQYSNSFELDIGGDRRLCEGETLTLDATTPGANYLWQNGTEEPTFSTSKAGTYWVRVFNGCLEQSDTMQLFYDAPLEIQLGSDTTLCEGELLFLDVGAPDATYQWQDGNNGSSYQVTEAGAYAVTVTNTCGSDSDFVQVDFVPPVDIPAQIDTVMCEGQRLLFDASDINADSYRWSGGATGPRFFAEAPGYYVAQVTNKCGTVTQEINIRECMRCEVYVPNAFSPNGDGQNDVFRPFSDCPLEDFSLKVYNRWGVEVFSSNDPMQGWNGQLQTKQAPGATYIWVLEYTVVEDFQPRQVQESGDVIILR